MTCTFLAHLRVILFQGVSGEGKSIESGGVRPDVQVRRQGAARPDHPHPRPGQGVSRLLPGQRRHEVLRPPATRRILSVERRLLTDQADALRRAELFAGQLVESDDAPGEHLKKVYLMVHFIDVFLTK
jgi:hypothetical protein